MADRWETLNLQTLVPAFVPAAADAASGVVGSVGSVLQVAVTLMNTARSFIIDVTETTYRSGCLFPMAEAALPASPRAKTRVASLTTSHARRVPTVLHDYGSLFNLAAIRAVLRL
jgi:hypothetical protein